MITQDQLEILRDAFVQAEDGPLMDKVSLSFDDATHTVVISFWDFDDEDYRLLRASHTKG